MSLKMMYITNNKEVALIAQKYGVDRICVDLETVGKAERQSKVDSVKSHHHISDIVEIAPLLTTSKMLVRVDQINLNSKRQIDAVIDAGAQIIMLPMWKSLEDVKTFLEFVGGRVKTILLLETKEAVECLDEVLENGGFDEIHIGLNDLHLSYGMAFMFEPLLLGIVEKVCEKIKRYNIPYGFGGIARLGGGLISAEEIITEYYRLGCSTAILSRSFCNVESVQNIEEIETIFSIYLQQIREYEESMAELSESEFIKNKKILDKHVSLIAKRLRGGVNS